MKFTFYSIDKVTGQDLQLFNGNQKEFIRQAVYQHLREQNSTELHSNTNFTVYDMGGDWEVVDNSIPSQNFLVVTKP